MANILGVMLTVANIQEMTAFFTDVLSFEKISSTHLSGAEYDDLYGLPNVNAEFAILRLGNEYLYLIKFHPHGQPFPVHNSNDLLFQHIAIVVNDMDAVHQILMKHGVTSISEHPITIPEWNQAAAGIRAFYFRSPEGHPLELIYFPENKGRALWHGQRQLMLGIDHTAIAVHDTDECLRFYRDQLGMTVAGESLNHGETQEALSGVPGAKVRITGLRYKSSNGMGLEFLHYLNPVTGKPAPAFKANDLGCTYTVIEVDSLQPFQHLAVNKGVFAPYAANQPQSALLIKDFDQHRVILVNKES